MVRLCKLTMGLEPHSLGLGEHDRLQASPLPCLIEQQYVPDVLTGILPGNSLFQPLILEVEGENLFAPWIAKTIHALKSGEVGVIERYFENRAVKGVIH